MGGKELSTAEKLSQQNERTPLASLYGAIQGLSELGAEVIKVRTKKYCFTFNLRYSLFQCVAFRCL